jgi:hypothetical protein
MPQPGETSGQSHWFCGKPFAIVALFLSITCQSFAQTPAVKAVGTIKSVNGNSLVVSADAGGDTSITIADSARILRTSPGQTDLKTATPIPATDIHVGDRVLARGQSGESGTLVASLVVVMAKSDIAQRQQQEQDEWRKGVGGIVKSVDVGAATITLANSLLASGKPILVHVDQGTQILRYAADSVKFDEAKPSSLDQIKPGDQMRARGTKNTDGTEVAARAIVSGSFREIAGTVISTDAPSNSVSVVDLATKKPITVKVSSESQLHKLPPMVAQMIAFRFKGGTAGTPPGSAATQGAAANGTAAGPENGSGRGQGNWKGHSTAGGERLGQGGAAVGGNWGNGGGPPDFQHMLSRMPAVTIADLNKGDAVMLVATEGSSGAGPTAITMLAGVEPILSATPSGTSAATLLSPWNLGASAGAGGDMSTQ